MSTQSPQRQSFKTNHDWQNFVAHNHQNPNLGLILNQLRQEIFKEIEQIRGRPLICYYTKFIEGTMLGTPNSIDLSDVDGFVDLVSSIPKDIKSIDVLIHSPGGQPDATERIVDILRDRFDEVHFLVPHSAYSAATMLALSGDSITMNHSATLGPIDPQINGMPARSYKRGFENARAKIMELGPESLPAYVPLIEKHTLEFLEICEDSENLSRRLVTEWIKKYMFKGKVNGKKVEKAVDFFSNYEEHLLHSRPLIYSKLKDFGLKIYQSEDNLNDLLREAHLVLNGFVTLTPFVKLFENTYGVSWGKQHQIIIQQGQMPPP